MICKEGMELLDRKVMIPRIAFLEIVEEFLTPVRGFDLHKDHVFMKRAKDLLDSNIDVELFRLNDVVMV